MNTFKAILKYKGTGLFGWQIQNGTQRPTVQGELHKALNKICSNRENSFTTLGSGRTDAGVHACAQVVRIEIDFDIRSEDLLRAVNSLLPSAIKIMSMEICESEFHPIFHAKSKEYRYHFSTKSEDPFMCDMITFFKKDLKIGLMQEACSAFIGKHDFVNFFCTGTDVRSTVREIYSCEIIKCSATDTLTEGHYLKISGSGFLKQMVRLIMGSLFNIGIEKINIYDLKDALNIKKKNKLGAVAPPYGLYLYKVNY